MPCPTKLGPPCLSIHRLPTLSYSFRPVITLHLAGMSSLRVTVPGSRSLAGISALPPRCHARFRAAAGTILTSGSGRLAAPAHRPYSTGAGRPVAAAGGDDERDSSQPPAMAGPTAQAPAAQPPSSKLRVLWQLVRRLAGPVAVLACAWLMA